MFRLFGIRFGKIHIICMALIQQISPPPEFIIGFFGIFFAVIINLANFAEHQDLRERELTDKAAAPSDKH